MDNETRWGIRDMIGGAIDYYSERDRLCELKSMRKAIKAFWNIGAINEWDYQCLMKVIKWKIKDIKVKHEKMIKNALEMLAEENKND